MQNLKKQFPLVLSRLQDFRYLLFSYHISFEIHYLTALQTFTARCKSLKLLSKYFVNPFNNKLEEKIVPHVRFYNDLFVGL